MWSALAAAAAVVVAVGALAVIRHDRHTDFKAQLSAIPLSPGARASAAVYRNAAGFHVELDASGLPRLRAGEYYQAWLKSSVGTLVPIGSFSSSDARATLWSGVSPKDCPTLSVTIEAADNDQRSSGRTVLAGPVFAQERVDT